MIYNDFEWEKERLALNHDWLGNRFLRAIDAFLLRLNADVTDNTRLQEFLDCDFREWPEYSSRFAVLIDSFEFCMSPARLLDTERWRKCGESNLDWMRDVIHVSWRHSYQIANLLNECSAAFNRCECLYEELPQEEQLVIQRSYIDRDGFRDFYEACRALNRAISYLPHRILFV